MDHMHHTTPNLTRQAISATLHCLTGCAIGEVAGMVLSTAVNASNLANIIISIMLAFVFGYGLSIMSVLKAGLSFGKALKVALAADTVSISMMELSDNGFILLVPGAINAGLNTGLFWLSLALSLVVAFIATVPVNRWLISRGLGHAVMHQYHH